MDEKVKDLVLEQLLRIRGDHKKLLEEIRSLKVEMVAMRRHRQDYELSQAADHDEISALKDRDDRSERQFELADDTNAQ